MVSEDSPYSEEWYSSLSEGSERSAVIMLGSLSKVWTPLSVIDVGCGKGGWLKAWGFFGVKELVGMEGAWLTKADLLCQDIELRTVDLNESFGLERKFSLAMSLEVAEHCKPESSETFVSSFASLSDALVFGAAYTLQPGNEHVNTRPHSFWCNQFLDAGFEVFDFFRPRFWGANGVDPWYQQNTFLYCKPETPLYLSLLRAGERPMMNPSFVDAVHPWLFNYLTM